MKSYYYWEAESEDEVTRVVKTEKDILSEHWDWWSRKMTEKYGIGAEEISEANCIHDWVTTRHVKEVDNDT